MIKKGKGSAERIAMLPDRQNTIEDKEVTGCGIEAEIFHVIFVWDFRGEVICINSQTKTTYFENLRIATTSCLGTETKFLYPSVRMK